MGWTLLFSEVHQLCLFLTSPIPFHPQTQDTSGFYLHQIPDYFWGRCAEQAGVVVALAMCLQQGRSCIPDTLGWFTPNLIYPGDPWHLAGHRAGSSSALCPATAGVCESEQTLTTSQNLFEMHFLSLLERGKKNRRKKKQHWRELSHKSVWYEPGDLKNQSWQLFY